MACADWSVRASARVVRSLEKPANSTPDAPRSAGGHRDTQGHKHMCWYNMHETQVCFA
jgi:hypothetical protein